MLPPTISLAGIAAPSFDNLRAVRSNIPWQVWELGTIGISLCFGVGLGLIRHAVAASTERTCLGNFRAWVDFRVRCGVYVFLERGIDGMTNVWHLFEYVAYTVATKKLRSATTGSHLSAIKFFILFHAVSRLTPLIPSSRAPSKVRCASMPKWVIRRPCAGPCRRLCCLLAKL